MNTVTESKLTNQDYIIADIALADFGRREIAIAETEMPGLMKIREEFSKEKPLKGARITGSLHMTIQTAVLIETLIDLGAEVRWASCNIYSTQDHAAAAIAKGGTPVFAFKGENLDEYWDFTHRIFEWADGSYTNMILDDGGDATLLLHLGVKAEKDISVLGHPKTEEEICLFNAIKNKLQLNSTWYSERIKHVKGVTEETTTGVLRLYQMFRDQELAFPAINVNDSVTKSKNDNKYGCRHSLNDGIKRGTDMLLAGKQAIVVGYGDVGKGSAQSLNQEGMIVKIAEIDPICAMQACMDGFEVVSPYIDGINTGTGEGIDTALLAKIDLIVTTTGNINVCDKYMLQSVKKGAVICNIGHFDNEIDTAYMRESWDWEEIKPQVHKIYRTGTANQDDYLILLSEGRLINLGNATGHPSRIMDGSFANQVLAQMFMFDRKFADLPAAEKQSNLYVEVLPKYLDEEVAAMMVGGFGGVLTRLTDVQAKYINVKVDGPYKSDSYKY